MKINNALLALLVLTSICSCANNQDVYAYIVSKPTSNQSDVSDWRPVMRVTYRITDGKVISEVANVVDEYDDCNILSIQNWECQYVDGTGRNSFGFTDGQYWEKPGWGKNIKYVSRWEYNLIRCKWYQFDNGAFKGTAMCLQTFV